MFDNRSLALLGQLTDMPEMSVSELSMIVGKSKAQTKQEIEELNRTLQRAGYPEVQLNNDKYTVPAELIVKEEEITQLFRNVQVYLDEQERSYILYLYTFARQTPVSNFHFQDLLHVSKNTALSDVKKLRKRLSSANLEFRYSRKDGYFIHGKEMDKRKVAFKYINELMLEPIGEWAIQYIFSSWKQTGNHELLVEKIQSLAPKYGLSFVEGRLVEAAYLIDFIRIRKYSETEKIDSEVLTELQNTNVHQLSLEVLDGYLSDERVLFEGTFLTMFFLGFTEGNLNAKPNPKLYGTTREVVKKMEALALMVFDDREKLIRSLYIHLVPAYYRIRFDFQTKNPLAQQIKEENEELFVLVESSLEPLEQLTGKALSIDEVAYFVIHFGGQIQRQVRRKEQYKAMIVCPNGVSSSLILKSELTQLFPEFYWLQEHSVDDFHAVPQSAYDMVFSTVFIQTDKPLYIVKPVMSPQTKNKVVQRVAKDFLLFRQMLTDVDELLAIISQYAEIKNEKKLAEALSRKVIEPAEYGRKYLPMLEDLLTEEYVAIYDNSEKELTWKEAIRLGCEPLLGSGKIEERYIQAIFDKLAEYGTFIDLGHGVAIPHARPDEGVIDLGMSLLKLAEPVSLLGDDDHKIDLFITLAAVDNETHLKALSQLTQILSDPKKLKALKEAETTEKIIELLKQREEKVNHA